MARILVAGLINIETTLKVESFPIPYSPVRYPFHGVGSTVSGVGYNIAKALTMLDETVDFLSIIGRDLAGDLARRSLLADGIPDGRIITGMAETAQSVILYDQRGVRQINTDLKDIQDAAYPGRDFEAALAACELAVLCNINFSRPYLDTPRRLGKLLATDVHAIGDLEDEYNRDFMATADILFMSDELLPAPPAEWAAEVMRRFGPRILVIGLGAQGALLCRPHREGQHIPAVTTRPVVNTIGAGDALFSAFLHGYLSGEDAHLALEKAVLFAAHKVGAASAADGFLSSKDLDRLYASMKGG